MTIAQRLYVLVLVASLGLIGVAGLSLVQTERVFTAADFANENTTPSLIVLDKAMRAFARVRVYTFQCLGMEDLEQRHQIMVKMSGARAEVTTLLDDYEKHDVTDEKDAALLKEDRKVIDTFNAINLHMVELINQGKSNDARSYALEHQVDVARVAEALEVHDDYNVELSRKWANEGRSIMSQARWQEGMASLAVLLVVAIIGIVMARRIARALSDAAHIAITVAGGDLTGHIDDGGKDEIGALVRALREMRDSLAQIVGQVRQGTETIRSASQEIAQGNMDLSSRTESQASSLEETAASMEELTSTVKQNSENAQQANQLAQSATAVAERGGEVVSQVVSTMSEINASSKKIVDIIGVIDSIAFQTNILALNAAVEAARAGEQGRGFAVVAVEVRNLAQRSAGAAKEIKELIVASVDKVEAGTQLVDQAGDTMKDVVQSIRRVTDIMAEINAAGAEQSQGIGLVNEAVMAMDSMTQQNSALVEEAAAAARAMEEQAGSLTGLVGMFKLDRAQPGRQLSTLPAHTVKRPATNNGNVLPMTARARRTTQPGVARYGSNVAAVAKPVGVKHEGADAWEEF